MQRLVNLREQVVPQMAAALPSLLLPLISDLLLSRGASSRRQQHVFHVTDPPVEHGRDRPRTAGRRQRRDHPPPAAAARRHKRGSALDGARGGLHRQRRAVHGAADRRCAPHERKQRSTLRGALPLPLLQLLAQRQLGLPGTCPRLTLALGGGRQLLTRGVQLGLQLLRLRVAAGKLIPGGRQPGRSLSRAVKAWWCMDAVSKRGCQPAVCVALAMFYPCFYVQCPRPKPQPAAWETRVAFLITRKVKCPRPTPFTPK